MCFKASDKIAECDKKSLILLTVRALRKPVFQFCKLRSKKAAGKTVPPVPVKPAYFFLAL
jgi:hypothetical protein